MCIDDPDEPKDLYIEVDRMIVQERMWSDFSKKAYPRFEVFADAEELFRQAPILNPDGSCGVSLHIDRSRAVREIGQGCRNDPDPLDEIHRHETGRR